MQTNPRSRNRSGGLHQASGLPENKKEVRSKVGQWFVHPRLIPKPLIYNPDSSMPVFYRGASLVIQYISLHAEAAVGFIPRALSHLLQWGTDCLNTSHPSRNPVLFELPLAVSEITEITNLPSPDNHNLQLSVPRKMPANVPHIFCLNYRSSSSLWTSPVFLISLL